MVGVIPLVRLDVFFAAPYVTRVNYLPSVIVPDPKKRTRFGQDFGDPGHLQPRASGQEALPIVTPTHQRCLQARMIDSIGPKKASMNSAPRMSPTISEPVIGSADGPPAS